MVLSEVGDVSPFNPQVANVFINNWVVLISSMVLNHNYLGAMWTQEAETWKEKTRWDLCSETRRFTQSAVGGATGTVCVYYI